MGCDSFLAHCRFVLKSLQFSCFLSRIADANGSKDDVTLKVITTRANADSPCVTAGQEEVEIRDGAMIISCGKQTTLEVCSIPCTAAVLLSHREDVYVGLCSFPGLRRQAALSAHSSFT